MSRTNLVTNLTAFKAGTPWEEDTRLSMLALLEQCPNSFHRNGLPGHFTASVYVRNPAGTKVLMLKHRKLGLWLQFGGHADGEEDLRGVAIKELREESGLPEGTVTVGETIFDLDMHIFPLRRNTRADDINLPHIHFDVRFAGVLDETVPIPGNHESEAIRWFTIDEALQLYTSQGNLRPLLKLAKRDLSTLGSIR